MDISEELRQHIAGLHVGEIAAEVAEQIEQMLRTKVSASSMAEVHVRVWTEHFGAWFAIMAGRSAFDCAKWFPVQIFDISESATVGKNIRRQSYS